MAFYGYTAIPQDYSYAARVGEGLGKLGAAVAGGVSEHKALKALRDDVAVKRDLIAEDLVNAGYEANAAKDAAARRIVMLPGSDSKTERERVANAWESALKFVDEEKAKYRGQTAHGAVAGAFAPAPPENPAVDRMLDRAHQPQDAQSSLNEPRPSERLLQGRPFPSISESVARDVKDVAVPSKLPARSPADVADSFLEQSKQSAWGRASSPGRLAPSTVTRDVADFADSVASDVEGSTPSSSGILPFMRRPRTFTEKQNAYAKHLLDLPQTSREFFGGELDYERKKKAAGAAAAAAKEEKEAAREWQKEENEKNRQSAEKRAKIAANRPRSVSASPDLKEGAAIAHHGRVSKAYDDLLKEAGNLYTIARTGTSPNKNLTDRRGNVLDLTPQAAEVRLEKTLSELRRAGANLERVTKGYQEQFEGINLPDYDYDEDELATEFTLPENAASRRVAQPKAAKLPGEGTPKYKELKRQATQELRKKDNVKVKLTKEVLEKKMREIQARK